MTKYILPFISLLFFAACTNVCQTTPCVCPCDSIPVVVPPPVDTSKNEFILGVNSNTWQPKEQQARMMSIRLYQPIGWIWTENGFYGEPMKQGQKQFLGLDSYLTYMKSKNVDVLLTLMGSPDWLSGHTQVIGTNDFPPIRPGADRNDPKSYSEIASIYKAFAIRYGSKVWPKGSYKIDSAGPRWNGDERQVEKSGMDLVKTIEIGNELSRWWNQEQYMTPEQYAIMLMVCHDSIKVGDPNMRVVMAGTTNFELPYLKAMNEWYKAHGRKFPSVAAFFHHYSSTGNIKGQHPPQWPVNGGVNWNEDKDFSTVSELIAWAKSVGMETWCGEYGYDTQPGSQLYPYALNGKTAEQLQAEWLVSTTLEYKRLGVSRCYIFTLADEPNPNAGTFTSSGLLYGEATGYKEKPAMKAIADLCTALKDGKLVYSLK